MDNATRPNEVTITRQDRVRASYFGLRLPIAPKVVEPAVEPTTRAKVEPFEGDIWMGETVALLLTIEAVEAIEVGRAVEADAVFAGLDRENRDAFFAFLNSIGCPVASWGEWVALCQAGFPIAFPALIRSTGRFVPTQEEQQEAATLLNGGRVAGTRRPCLMSRPMPSPTANELTDADVWPGGVC